METRRLLLAVFLSLLIVFLWNSIFAPPVPIPPPAETPAEETAPGGPSPESPEAPPPGAEAAGEGTPSPSSPTPPAPGGGALEEAPSAEPILDFGAETVVAEVEERVAIETERVRVEISNRGGQLTSFLLKEHRTPEGELLELVRDRGADPYPFALVADGNKSHRLNRGLFTWERERTEEGEALRLRHRSDRGTAEKVFRMTPEGFLDVEVTVAGERNWGVMLGPGIRNLEDEDTSERFLQRAVGYQRGEEVEVLKPEKQDEETILPALGLRWVTLEDNFFIAAAVPEEGVAGVLVRPVLQRSEVEPDQPRFVPLGSAGEDLKRVQMLLVESSGERMRLRNYFGAKRYSRLVALPYGLEETVRFGWFGFLAKPLYFGLEWIHSEWVANYGWAIVLITVLIKILFFPLTHKSQESMGKMQELNPKVQAIRAKYRGKLKDKQGRPNLEAQRQMNEEVMKVYKSAGVNPASGCLPLLLQMPVFFALFRLLSTAVELRNAPWILWIRDLSAPDPYFILPIVMGATSLAMQRMMPSSPDPMQRRMMQMMPLVFVFFAFAFPSGLVLYWVTNNILTMGQQALLLKLKKRREDGDSGKDGKDDSGKKSKSGKESKPGKG